MESTSQATLCLTIDNMGDARMIGRGQAARPDADEYSIKVGVPAFLDLFADLQVQATYFIEGWNALHRRDVIEKIAAAGHEIGLHGWLHEYWAKLDDRTREQLLWDGTAALRLAGFDPRSFRAPGMYRGTHTLEVLGELGYRVDSSIDPDGGQPGQTPHPQVMHNGILNIPWTMDMSDYWHYVMIPDAPRHPDVVADYWIAHIDAAAESGAVIPMIIHPFVNGVDCERMAALRRTLEHALQHPRVAVKTALQAADAFLSPVSGQ